MKAERIDRFICKNMILLDDSEESKKELKRIEDINKFLNEPSEDKSMNKEEEILNEKSF